MHVKDIQRGFLPTETQIQDFEAKGWIATDYILPEELIDEAIRGADDLYKGNRNRDCREIVGPANDVYDETKVLMNNEYACLQRSEIWDVVSFPMISAIAARLARTDEIRLFADALMCKFPATNQSNGVFGWHTDKAYWPSCTSNDMLTAWIPFQDVTLDMGPMYVMENSHRWEWTDEVKAFCAAGNQDLEQLEQYCIREQLPYRKVPMTLKKGQISFHNCNTFHGSSVNTSSKRRMTLTIHFQDARNTFKQAYDANGDEIRIGYERVCGKDSEGYPDYRDPEFFPVLFRDR